MKSGKLLCLIGGIIALVSTFLFAWFFVDEGGNHYYGHGLGVLFSLPDTFGNAEAIASSWGPGIPTFAIYIVGGILIVFLFSWLLILFGMKNRIVPIIGGFIIAGMSLAMIFGPFGTPPNILDYVSPFSSEAWGLFPFNIPIGPVGLTVGGSAGVSLGAYLLLGGGVLGIIGGFLPRK